MHMPMIAQRVFNTPLLVDPAKGHAFLSGLGARIVDGRLRLPAYEGESERAARAARVGPRASILGSEAGQRARERGRRLYGVRDGIAIVEVTGTLVHRGDWIGESSGVTTYEGIAQQVEAAAEDPAVRGIALEIDTFGGEVAGVFDLADSLRAARGRKPVWAFVAEAALSAGYALASQADRIVLPRTGEVGSIGVLLVHADYSERLSDEGVRVTLIHAGAHKVDANPSEPLPEAVRDELQAEVEALRELFAATVAAGRGGLSAAAALATEARVFRGSAAVAAGLADEVSDLRTAFGAFVASVQRRQPAAITTAASGSGPSKEHAMTGTTNAAPVAEDMQPAVETEQTSEATLTEAEAAPEQEAAQAVASRPAASAPDQIGRADAAALAEVGAHAARLGVRVDVAAAIREGLSPDALRQRVLEQAAARSDSAGIVAAAPPVAGKAKESPVVAAAKRAAEAARKH